MHPRDGSPSRGGPGGGAQRRSAGMLRYVVSTVNKQYKPGLVDGRAGSARFRAPSSVCELPLAAARRASDAPDEDKKHAKAAVLVADTGNNVLRLLLMGSGSSGSAGWWVGRFAPKTTLMQPRGVCVLPDSVLVCDSGHHRIRCVALDGSSAMPYAGSGKKGHKDGPVESAQFDTPSHVCVCPSDKSIIVGITAPRLHLHAQCSCQLCGLAGEASACSAPGPVSLV